MTTVPTTVPAHLPGAAVAARPTPESERALRQALGYIERGDVPGTKRVYAADLHHFTAWCPQAGLAPLPATPTTLAAHAESYALATLRRHLATMRRYVRRAKPSKGAATARLEL